MNKRGLGEQHGFRSGGHRTPEYTAWTAMRQRCLDKKCKAWPYYGGRGIQICDSWLDSFVTFLQDMGEKPEPKEAYSLDRRDPDKGYYPGNCRWATAEEQANNRRNNINVSIGNTTRTAAQWSRETGLSYALIRKNVIESKTNPLSRTNLPPGSYKTLRSGDRIGLLTVRSEIFAGPNRRKHSVTVQCVCGLEQVADVNELHRGDKISCGGSACRTVWRRQLKREQGSGIWRLSAKCSAVIASNFTLYRIRSLNGTHLGKRLHKEGHIAVIYQRCDRLHDPVSIRWVPKPASTSSLKWISPLTKDDAIRLIEQDP